MSKILIVILIPTISLAENKFCADECISPALSCLTRKETLVMCQDTVLQLKMLFPQMKMLSNMKREDYKETVEKTTESWEDIEVNIQHYLVSLLAKQFSFCSHR